MHDHAYEVLIWWLHIQWAEVNLNMPVMEHNVLDQPFGHIRTFLRYIHIILTPIMASFTRSFWISPALNKFSINSVLVDPEQYHAIVIARLLRFDLMRLNMGVVGKEKEFKLHSM